MSVLVYAEHSSGKFKKSTYEVVSYGYAIASKLNIPLSVISIGDVSQEELSVLAKYGASKILNVSIDKLKTFVNQAYAAVIAAAAKQENASVVVMNASFTGKGLAPRVAETAVHCDEPKEKHSTLNIQPRKLELTERRRFFDVGC